MTNKQNDSFINYLAATAPALLQLVAVLSVGLVNILRLDEYVLTPRFINMANFLTVLISISLISLASFWDYNKFSLLKANESIFDQTKKFWSLLKIVFLFVLMGFILFVLIAINKVKIDQSVEMWSFIQWFSYIVSMTSVSFIIYSYALLKVQEKNNKNLQENYIPRLLDSLRRNGHVDEPDVIIDSIDRENNMAIVRFTSAQKFKVITDYTGEMVSILPLV
jgi:hypothetical protein